MSSASSGLMLCLVVCFGFIACAPDNPKVTPSTRGGGGGTFVNNGGGNGGDSETESEGNGNIVPGVDGGEFTSDDQEMDSDTVTPLMCVENTHDEPECLDCCGCLSVSCEEKVACRESCAGHLYDDNRSYIDVEMPSEVGEFGDYLSCTIRGESPACRECCLCSEYYLCGDITYCEVACDDLS